MRIVGPCRCNNGCAPTPSLPHSLPHSLLTAPLHSRIAGLPENEHVILEAQVLRHEKCAGTDTKRVFPLRTALLHIPSWQPRDEKGH